MSYRKYDHNVDIKSTQLSQGLKNIAKFIAFVLGGGVGIFGVMLIVIVIAAMQQHNSEMAGKDKAEDISSFQIQKRIDDDSVNNPPRYDVNWSSKWVTFTGEVTNISTYSFEVFNQSHKWGSRVWANVICDFKSDQKGRVAQLDKGTRVKIVGKLSVSKPYDTVKESLGNAGLSDLGPAKPD
jgi:hypothetical protein